MRRSAFQDLNFSVPITSRSKVGEHQGLFRMLEHRIDAPDLVARALGASAATTGFSKASRAHWTGFVVGHRGS